MTTTATNAWMPAGRHEINIGPSLTRALKARKSGPIKNNKLKPDREFYSFRYNFKPESVDATKPGSIEIGKPKDEAGASSVSVVRPSTQNEHGVNFIGQEKSAKEFECVLIYDEELGTITLEKIDSYVALHHDPKPLPRHVSSPAPAAPPRNSASTSASSSLEAAEKHEEEESEGEIPDTKPKPPTRPSAPVATSRPKPSPRGPSPSSQARSPQALPVKPVPIPGPQPKAKGKALVASAPATVPPASSKVSTKRGRPAEPDEETLEIRRPTQPPVKKVKVAPAKKEPSPPPRPSSPILFFPNSSSAVSLPPPLAAVPDPVATAVLSDSDEDEWDEVQPSIPAPLSASASVGPRIVMEEIEPSSFTPSPAKEDHPLMAVDENEGEEIDMAAFEEMLVEQLQEPGEQDGMGLDDDDDDFLAGAVSPVAERQPVPLSQYPSGGGEFGDDDEYSSSDDSDDD